MQVVAKAVGTSGARRVECDGAGEKHAAEQQGHRAFARRDVRVFPGQVANADRLHRHHRPNSVQDKHWIDLEGREPLGCVLTGSLNSAQGLRSHDEKENTR